jgi:hypothetical protein
MRNSVIANTLERIPQEHRPTRRATQDRLRLIRVAPVGDSLGVRRLSSIVLAAVAVLAMLSTPARADDAAESRFFDDLARSAYERQRWVEALEAFLRAYRAAPSTRTLYNVGVCAQLAQREAMAFAYFDEFLAQPDADAALRADATTRHQALAARLALVRVVSDPPGAEIYVDRRDLGSFGRTPRTLALATGPHRLEIELADHATVSVDVAAVVGATRETRVTLAPHEGRLTVDVTPSSATLTVRCGASEAAAAPGQTLTLPVGTCAVTASAPGFRDASVELRLARDADERRVLALEPVPIRTGRVLVTTSSVQARVRVDGRDRAETPARLDAIPVGAHEVTVSAPGYLDWTGTVTVDEGRTAFVAVTLVRAR